MRFADDASIAVIDAASTPGDAAMRAAVIAGAQVRALSLRPRDVTRFSPAVSVCALQPANPEAMIDDLAGVSAVILTLGATREIGAARTESGYEELLTLSLLRAMSEDGIRTLAVSAPMDALRVTVDNRADKSAPSRSHGRGDAVAAVKGVAAWFRSVGSARGAGKKTAAPTPSQRRAEGLLDTRRAVELVRMSGLRYTLLAHPPVIVAPGPAECTSVPLHDAPKAAREISASDLATHLVQAVTAGSEKSGEFVVSEWR